MRKLFRIGFILGAIILFGAGCAKQVPTPVPYSGTPIPEGTALSKPTNDNSSGVANYPTEPSLDSSSFVNASPAICPVNPAILKAGCGLSGEVTQKGCNFSVTSGKSKFSYPLLQAAIADARYFGAEPGSTVAQVIEAQRLNMNKGIGGQDKPSLDLYTCDRWETKAVSGLGDEALMTPLTVMGCTSSHTISISELEENPNLFVRVGTKVAQIASFQGDVNKYGGHSSKVEGCSPEEVIQIARQYVIPAM